MSALNLFVVGTTKGGTSTLHRWLQQHPDVFLPERKEMHFFCRCPELRGPSKAVRDTVDYQKHFEGNTSQIIGEATPCYMYYPEVPAAIAGQFPSARIVVSLRDPVERFWSHYLMNEVYRPTNAPPETIVESGLHLGPSNALEDLVGVGMYHEQLERVFAAFGRDRVFVTFLEAIACEPEQVALDLQLFLGIDPIAIDVSERDKQYVEPRNALGRLALRNRRIRQVGVALIPWRARRFLRTKVLGDPEKKPHLSEDLQERLRDIYRSDSRKLEILLGRELPWDWHRYG